MTTTLDVRGMTKRFQGVVAVEDVSFTVGADEIVGLIGPNGAGKTTVINLLTAFASPDAGEVVLEGRAATRWSTHRRVRAGLTRTFQAPVVFASLTVRDNLVAAIVAREGLSLRAQLLRSPGWRRITHEAASSAEELASFVGLGTVVDMPAGELAYGHRKMLGIALGLSARPRVLLMDEPTAGLSPGEREEVAALLGRIRDRGIGVLVVEHDMKLIMGSCDRIVVLNYGRKIAEGTPDEVRADPRVIEAYLGGAHDAA